LYGAEAAKTLSVVIPARNAAETIVATLRSIADERELVREVLIVNDGSSDQTGKLAFELGVELTLPVKVISVSFNNAGAARNAGIRHATGDLLLLLDADDELIAGGLRVLTERLLTDPEADVVVGGYIRRMEGGTEKLKMPKSYGDDRRRNAHDYLSNRHRSIAMGSALMRRRAVGDATFPETVAYDEDTFFWAAVLSRASVVTVASPIIVYNADSGRMERRFTTAPHHGFTHICIELDKLARFGIGADTLNWRKGWLARRVARALIRQGEYTIASDFMRLAAFQHPRIRWSKTTVWYWAKICTGSILRRLR
jgi:glycosyltransferase involved in cell wall biosynthesis